jgi:hypothetical protein
MLYNKMSYVKGVLYNMLCVLFAPFAAVFRGSHVLAAPEPLESLSPDLVVWLPPG